MFKVLKETIILLNVSYFKFNLWLHRSLLYVTIQKISAFYFNISNTDPVTPINIFEVKIPPLTMFVVKMGTSATGATFTNRGETLSAFV